MNFWLSHKTIFFGISMIIMVNVFFMAEVTYNRSGEPDSRLRLTQRELQLPPAWLDGIEYSGLILRWRAPVDDTTPGIFYPDGIPAWMDSAKLESLGFDVTDISMRSSKRYLRLFSKEVFLVMEFDGPVYQQMLERARLQAVRATAAYAENPHNINLEHQADEAKNNALREERENSRLFVVDASLDKISLRAKYPDRSRYAIIRGEVRPQLIVRGKDQQLTANVSSITQINVPIAFRPAFEHQPARSGVSVVHYQAELCFGKRLEPWVSSVTPPQVQGSP